MMGMAPGYLGNKFIFRGSVSGQVNRSFQQLNKTGQRSFPYRIVNTVYGITYHLKFKAASV